MPPDSSDIIRRQFKHGKVAYNFQWNRTNHERIGKANGDSASLWAHLESVARGRISEEPFTNQFYRKASSLRFKKMTKVAKTGYRRKLERSNLLQSQEDSELVRLIREFHRELDDTSSQADHSILVKFLYADPASIAIEVPVWSDQYNLSGHIDLVRIIGNRVQVCDYKPGPLERTASRFFDSIPQIAAYGEMMSYHLASTLRPALDAPIIPKVECVIFDTHAAWSFVSEMFLILQTTGMLREF